MNDLISHRLLEFVVTVATSGGVGVGTSSISTNDIAVSGLSALNGRVAFANTASFLDDKRLYLTERQQKIDDLVTLYLNRIDTVIRVILPIVFFSYIIYIFSLDSKT